MWGGAQPHTHSLAACTPTDQQQLRDTCPTTPTLSAALLFTSFRQTHEFEANAHLLKGCSGVRNLGCTALASAKGRRIHINDIAGTRLGVI